ncbi:MAG: SDR family oxidoreductase [Oscillospiraceae bacterium]|nr:SDR family oxidoreductase [Oscillospiraceae bacterium]
MLKIDLTGRTALVTGASGELGRVTARTLAACGADVAVHYCGSRDRAMQTVEAVKAQGRRSVAVQADVTDFESVTRMAQEVQEALGTVSLLVANAVIQYEWKSVLDQPLADFQSQFASCAMQTVHLAKAFLPGMIAQHYGRIVCINTECAAMAEPGVAAYTAGKRALDGVVRCLAKEVGMHGITVNQVAPGWTISDRDRLAHTEEAPDYVRTVPLGRRGTDTEIANMTAFLLSDLASFTTGAYIPVSGGRVMPAI